MTGPNVPVSGPEDGARERVARVLAAHEPRYRSQHGEPDWFECGPDNDGPTTCTWRSDPEADSEVIAEAFRLHVADALLSVVADTTAGEADLAEGRRLVANVLSLPEVHRVEVGADLIARSLAARSGGAQDDGLRGRIEAETLQSAWEYAREATRQGFAEGRGEDFTRHWAATAGWLKHRRDAVLAGDDPNWPDAARALAGPDDARQDGAR